MKKAKTENEKKQLKKQNKTKQIGKRSKPSDGLLPLANSFLSFFLVFFFFWWLFPPVQRGASLSPSAPPPSVLIVDFIDRGPGGNLQSFYGRPLPEV